MSYNNPDHIKTVVDWVSVGTVISTVFGWLPEIAALFTLMWTIIRIWETETVKNWRNRKKN